MTCLEVQHMGSCLQQCAWVGQECSGLLHHDCQPAFSTCSSSFCSWCCPPRTEALAMFTPSSAEALEAGPSLRSSVKGGAWLSGLACLRPLPKHAKMFKAIVTSQLLWTYDISILVWQRWPSCKVTECCGIYILFGVISYGNCYSATEQVEAVLDVIIGAC